jgi:hypothetical protein
VPEVACPHPLYGITLGELRKNGVYPVAKPPEEGAPFGSGIALLTLVGREELYTPIPRQLFLRFGRPVVALTDHEPSGGLKEFRHDGKLVGVGRSHRQAGSETRPAHTQMYPEAVEGLPEQSVLAESGFTQEAATAVGAGEEARWQWHRVYEREGRIVRGEEEEILPKALLYLPEVSRLPGEGGTVDLAYSREPLAVVAAEEEVDALIGVDAEELSNLGAGPRWRMRCPLRRSSMRQKTMKVLRSITRRPPLRPVLLSQHRA